MYKTEIGKHQNVGNKKYSKITIFFHKSLKVFQQDLMYRIIYIVTYFIFLKTCQEKSFEKK